MDSDSQHRTVLLVEADAILGQVLGRILAREGLDIVYAVNRDQALRQASQHTPRLAVIDCFGREENGRELADELHTVCNGLPVILIAAHALGDLGASAGKSRFARVITKPINVRDLRQALGAALSWTRDRERGKQGKPFGSRFLAISKAGLKELYMGVFLSKLLKTTAMLVLILVVLAGFVIAMGGLRFPWQTAAAEELAPPPRKPTELGVELVKGMPHTLAVPQDVRQALGIRKGNEELIATAKKPKQNRALVLPGSTALDPARMYRVRARFAPSPSSAEVVEIAQVPESREESGKVETVFREIRSGDHVKKGDLLAVFYSVDVGNKKNDLIDAIYQLSLDEQILKKAEAKAEAVPEVFLWNARRAVQGDINTINRAVSTLETWGIPAADIQAVRDEAENVKKREGKHDKAKDALWARVEMRAPDDGVIVERNVALHEIIVDNTTNLFQIAKVDRLFISGNVPEDELPALQALPTAQRQWMVHTVGSPPVPGFISDIGYIIDPSQHTAVVKGYIDNPHEALRAGQFVSATVELPAPADVVEVPIEAVVDDGLQCVVFVETDAKKHLYTMRRVQLTQRFDRTVFVRSKPFSKSELPAPDEEEPGLLPKEPLRPGECILRSGVGELKAALLDKESQPNKGTKDK